MIKKNSVTLITILTIILTLAIENDALVPSLVFSNRQLSSIDNKHEKSNRRRHTKCYVNSSFEWDDYIAALEEYKQNNNGDANVPQNYVQLYKKTNQEMRLGQWVNNQRNAYRYVLEGNVQTTWGSTPLRISLKRMAQLDSIGFVWDVFEMEWDKHFNHLKAYYQQYGHSLVPQQHEVYDENDKIIKLGKWVANQRAAYRQFHKMKDEEIKTKSKKNNTRKMSWRRIIQLESIGFSWDGKTKLTQNVDINNESQKRNVDSNYDHYLSKSGKYPLSSKFQTSWGDRKWYQYYQSLIELIEKKSENDLRNESQIPENLNRWISSQKYQYQLWEDGKISRLTRNRKEALDAIGFIPWVEIHEQRKSREKWLAQFKKLNEYYDDQDLTLKKSPEEEIESILLTNSLRLWIQQQKKRYKQKRLDKRQKELLDSINFMQREATAEEKELDENIRILKAYKAKFGNCLVPSTTIVNNNSSSTIDLGLWVKKQRFEYARLLSRSAQNKTSNSLLTDEVQDELNSIGFVWNQDEAEWLEMYNICVLRYQTLPIITKNQDLYRYDVSDAALESWVRKQRRKYLILENGKFNCGDNRLTQMRVDALEKLDNFMSDSDTKNMSHSTKEHDYDMDWEVHLKCLKEYRMNFGHTIVPFGYVVRQDHHNYNISNSKTHKTIKLGEWVKIQRQRFSNTTRNCKYKPLNEEQIEELNTLDFIWYEDDFQWLAIFVLELRTFINEHGHCNVPSSNGKLSRWISKQRSVLREEYDKGMTEYEDVSKLDDIDNICAIFRFDNTKQMKVKALNAVHFIWDLKAYKEETLWNSYFKSLCSYQSTNGNCQVPSRFIVKDEFDKSLNLGSWVRKTQLEYRKFLADNREKTNTKYFKSGSLTWERKQKLDTLIGFNTTFKSKKKKKKGKLDEKWLSQTKKLGKFIKSNGHCNIEYEYNEEKHELSSWVKYIRNQYSAFRRGRQSSLSEKKIRDLEALGFIWNKKAAKWDQKYTQYKSYKVKLLDKDYEVESDGLLPDELQTWVNQQRLHYKDFINGRDKGNVKITNEQIDKLNRLGFDWKIEMKKRSKNNASKKSITTADLKVQKWDEMFHFLKLYKEKYGNCNVPRDFIFHNTTKLATWVLVQRREYKKLSNSKTLANASTHNIYEADKKLKLYTKSHYMTPEREEKLNSIGFIWYGQVALQVLRESKWNEMYEQLKEFYAQYGHFRVPRSHGKLGVWVSNQKRIYTQNERNDSSTSLKHRRMKLLNSIGFEFKTN